MSVLGQIERVIVFLIFLLLPTQLGLHLWPDWTIVSGRRVDYFAPTLYFTDILIIVLFLLTSTKLKNFNIKFEIFNQFSIRKFLIFRHLIFRLIGYLVIGLLALVNIYFSLSPQVSLYKWLKVAEFGFLFWWIVRNRLPTTVYRLLLISVGYTSLLAILQFWQQSSIGGLWYWLGERTFTVSTLGIATVQLGDRLVLRPYATFPHPNVLGGFLAIVLPLVVGRLLKTKLRARIVTLLHCCIVMLGFLALLLTMSRVAIIVGLVALTLTITRLFKALNTRILLILLSLLLLLPNLLSLGTEQESLSVRSQLNSIAIEQFNNSPLVGTGLGTSPLYTLTTDYPSAVLRTSRLRTTNYSLSGQPPHNIYLLLLSETGLIGLAVFLLVLISIYRTLLTNLVTNYHSLVAISSVVLLGLFDHYLLTLQQGQLLLVVILAVGSRRRHFPT